MVTADNITAEQIDRVFADAVEDDDTQVQKLCEIARGAGSNPRLWRIARRDVAEMYEVTYGESAFR